MAACYEAVGHVPICCLAVGTAGIEPNVSCEVIGALVVSALLPREDLEDGSNPQDCLGKGRSVAAKPPLLWSHSSVIQSVAPVFHHHRLSRQDRLGVRGEHFGTPKVLLRLIHSDLRR